MTKIQLLALCFFLAMTTSCGGGSSSVSVDRERVEAAVADFRTRCSGLAQTEVPGASAAVLGGDFLTLLVTDGVADLSTGREVIANDLFYAGSITKTFTAAWIMQLDQEEKLSIDDPLSKYLAFPRGDEITLRQLLAHTSGITSFTMMEEFAEWMESNPSPSPREVLGFMRRNARWSFEPGQTFEYSNSNYYLLGLIGEEVTGKSWHEEIRDRFLDPYALGSSYVYGYEPGPPSNVQGYTACPEPHCQPAGLAPTGDAQEYRLAWAAGSLVSTPRDLAKWMQALVAGPVLDAAHRREMQTVTPQSVAVVGESATFAKGVGLCLFQYYTPAAGLGWGHEGQIGGFGSVAAFFPDLGAGLALSANEVSSDVYSGLRLLVNALAPSESD